MVLMVVVVVVKLKSKKKRKRMVARKEKMRRVRYVCMWWTGGSLRVAVGRETERDKQ
jgi:hypothetical protein